MILKWYHLGRMKLITRDTDYAVRALSYIAASKEETVTVNAMGEALDMPHAFLRKILQTLNREGLLQSYKGKSGGFALAVHPDKITLVGLIEIFQGPFQLSEHVFKGKTCRLMNTCRLKKRLDKIEERTVRELKTITIASLLK